jgi:hypothetical protein
LLRVFAGLDLRTPEPDRAVVLACPTDGPLRRADLPSRPDPLPDWAREPEDHSLRVLHEQPVRAIPFLSVGLDLYDLRFDGVADALERLWERIVGGPVDAQVLGRASTVQGEMMVACVAAPAARASCVSAVIVDGAVLIEYGAWDGTLPRAAEQISAVVPACNDAGPRQPDGRTTVASRPGR